MDRHELREYFQQSPKLFTVFIDYLFPGGGVFYCNPDFLVLSEEAARASQVFVGTADFPVDEAEIQAAFDSAVLIYPIETPEELVVKEVRKKDYEDAGLTFEYWNEICIEDDNQKISKYKELREKIKLKHPKP